MFVWTHRMCVTKSHPSCLPWTVGGNESEQFHQLEQVSQLVGMLVPVDPVQRGAGVGWGRW